MSQIQVNNTLSPISASLKNERMKTINQSNLGDVFSPKVNNHSTKFGLSQQLLELSQKRTLSQNMKLRVPQLNAQPRQLPPLENVKRTNNKNVQLPNSLLSPKVRHQQALVFEVNPPPKSKATRISPLGQQIFNTQGLNEPKTKNMTVQSNMSTVASSRNASRNCSRNSVNLSLDSIFEDKQKLIEEKKKLQESYIAALVQSQLLAVNANKFRKSKFLLLFSIQERDEVSDKPIGNLDNQVRKKVMSICFSSIKEKSIGPGCQKGSFMLSNKKLMEVIKDVYKIRKAVDEKWLDDYIKNVEKLTRKHEK